MRVVKSTFFISQSRHGRKLTEHGERAPASITEILMGVLADLGGWV